MPTELYALIHCHVVIRCSIHELLSRRAKDTSKKRTLDRRLVEREQRGEIVVAREIARKMQTSFHIVHNGGRANYAAKRLGDIINAQWNILPS